MQLSITKGNKNTFIQCQDQILEIYLDTGTTGVMEQYMNKEEETAYMLKLFDAQGYAYYAFNQGKLVGFMISCSLDHDEFLPDSIKDKFPIGKCYYISEMHVTKQYQRKGIGSQLMKKFIEEMDKSKWEYLFIRAWKANTEAIKFYQRNGFQLSEIIDQEKTKKDQSGTFMIQKQYLWQKI